MNKRAFAIAVTVMLMLPILTGCAGLSAALEGGCTSRDKLLAPDLAKLAVLDQKPPGAVPGRRWSGCSPDGGFAYAGRNFRSDLSRDEIMAFYRTTLPQDGWKLTAENAAPPRGGLAVTTARLCFDKEINGTIAHVGFAFSSDHDLPQESGQPAPTRNPYDEFGLEVTASYDGEAWC